MRHTPRGSTDTDIDSVVALAFEHTAGAVPHPSADIPSAREWVSAALFISGPWECVVTLAVDSALASTLTSAMWDTAEVSRADVDDAVGELANLVAGGVKGMTPHPGCSLSTPVVARGDLPASVLAAVLPDAERDHTVRAYLVGEHPVVLSVQA